MISIEFLILIFIYISIFIYILINNKEDYINLRNDWSQIFPDGNRNAAGSKFFKYIIDSNLDYNKFIEMNKLYCSVSGSLIEPNSEPYFIKLLDLNDNSICGDYYACCWPCICDIMKYAKVIKTNLNFKNSSNEVSLIVIDNPCMKEFPKEVNKKYFCKNNKIDTNQVYSVSNKIVIGILHNAKLCNNNNITRIHNNEISGNKCRVRNNMNIEDLTYGMGDIFIKLAK